MKINKTERVFQASFIKRIKSIFPGCIILKNDPNYIQGIPDLIVLNGNRWVALECKRSSDSKKRPNQDYYISKMNKMSYASFVNPENEGMVLNEIQKTFGS